MKRWLLAALLGLLGCGNDSALAPPACGQRCHGEVVTLTWNEGFVMPVDLVLIADPALLVGSGAEVRYQQLMSSIGQRRFDLHLAVLPASPGPAGRLLPRGTDCAADLPFIDAPRTCGMAPNYDGAVEGLVSCLIGPATGLAHQPLEALRLALAEARPGSFLRPDAFLWIIIVGAHDDDSRDELGELVPVGRYVESLAALRAGVGKVGVSVIGRSTSRLRQFAAGATESVLVDFAGDWSYAAELHALRVFNDTFPCIPPMVLDTDAASPGIRPDCVVSEWVGYQEPTSPQALPRCGSGVIPCFEVRPASVCPSSLILQVERGGCDAVSGTTLQMSCAVER
ncbi:MAG TPA: hypothetical protein VN914_12435 [Polyangia bacterium]|nr:hypothetical protein [Polyangia bacterium]